jgi:hypothetical protein
VNDGARVIPWPGRAWPPTARPAAAIIVTAVLILAAAACSSSPSSTGPGGSSNAEGPTNSPSAVAYSACMRSNGVPNFPDPGSNGQVPKTDAQRLGVSSSELRSAQQACHHLYPTSSLEQCSETGDCSPADRQELMGRMLEFAGCMRAHGVPDFPDPATGPDGAPYFNLLHLQGVDPRSQAFERKSQECFPKLGGVNIHVERP